ncbi:hypothetical protein HMN09_00574900 [Mycena chlorophos]|uniref:Zn(2)-C6 fungal-type domain-containing protein n=1 Tax=Mycena chlorophos TaxID=658473 RepID=A0A8H6TCE9_MYCCL|nr:hypothetical protein HMN09_00574900 [Mycena chlorophos]
MYEFKLRVATFQLPNHGAGATLEKGKACFNCRRRKIRCDGARPTCGQCRHLSFVDCAFTDGGRCDGQLVEERIRLVQARIAGLEKLKAARDKSSSPSSASSPEASTLNSPVSSPDLDAETSPRLEVAPSDWTLDALTLDLLPHSSNIGFFLDVDSIRRSFITSTTIPSCLRTTLHLWSAHLSNDPLISALEPNLLSRAISESISPTRTISDAAPNINSTHQIQASVLLSTYFFLNARLVEGRYHLSRATASATVLASRTSGPAQTEIRMREALLTTQALTCCWESANASPPEPSPPPPTTSSDYLAQYASAAHLYRRATLLASQTSRECIPDKFAVSLEVDQALADQDSKSLPSASPSDRGATGDAESESQTRILIPALLHSAQIHVFSALLEEHAYARQKSRAAAHAILSLLVEWGDKYRDEGMSGRLLDPIFAPICASSCRILISEIARRRRGRDSSLDSDLSTELKPLLDALYIGVRIMQKNAFPLMGRKRDGGGKGVV